MIVLLPFGPTCLCEMIFFALSNIKNKYRPKLEVEDSLCVTVSHIKPRIGLGLWCFKRIVHILPTKRIIANNHSLRLCKLFTNQRNCCI